ncbi:uncharacterized protein VTP21DRAFT_9604 [Calcarisporiella thermophila]|uniref:uncharacterized protein n=1 Tax=Calcarisporiella thermophila TaxID=911321 RepID=UPI003742DE8F
MYEYGRIDQTSLHQSVQNGDVDSVRAFARNFEQFINTGDRYGLMPLHYATKDNLIHMARLLVTELRAKVNSMDDGGKTPLHVAAENGHYNMFTKLVTWGTEVKMCDKYGLASMHFAAAGEKCKLVKRLSKHCDADANARTEVSGRRCIMLREEDTWIW